MHKQGISERNRFEKVIWWIGISLLILYPLRHVWTGVDLWDTGYNYANFTYMGTRHMDSMWLFATWISNILGALFTRLPFGSTMAGMNVYAGLIVSAIGVTSFVFGVKKIGIPAWIAFAGEIIALSLCWLPAAVLYNYLTYGLLLAGTLLLYQGLTEKKDNFLILAGIVLGLNVGVRFSNLVQAGLILAVWAYGIICKKKLSQVLKETGLCILGYVGAVLSFLLLLAGIYGMENYVEATLRLLQMPEHAEDYSVQAMLTGMVWAYFHSAYWLKRFLLAAFGGVIICLALPRKWKVMKRMMSILLFLPVVWWLKKNGFYSMDYTTYQAIFFPCVIFLTMIMGLSCFQILSRDVEKEEKLLSGLLILTVLLASLGGNNAIYSSINNLFLVMPCALWMIWKFCRERKADFYFPIKCMLLLALLFASVQSVRFGTVFVYEEAAGGRNLNTKIEGIPVLEGMSASAEKARWLTEVYDYIEEQQLGDRECILYGQIPGMAYYMRMAPALNIWADLRSYSYQTMELDMKKVETKIEAGESRPVILLEASHAQYILDRDGTHLFREETARQKMDIICTFVEKYGYERTFSNEKFVIYE